MPKSDRFGARSMMTFYVVVWSGFTAFTGMVTGLTMLLVARIGCGLAQAGAYPTSGGLLGRWVPLRARSRANSVVAFGGRLGGALAPVLTVVLIAGFGGWRPVLILYGLGGIGVAGLFWFVFRERPEAHPLCNPAESALINEGRLLEVAAAGGPAARIPIRHLLTSRSMWLMCVSQWATNLGWGNMWGNLGAAATAGFLPWVLKHWDPNHDWHAALIVCAASFVVAGIAALGIDASVPLGPPEPEKPVDQ